MTTSNTKILNNIEESTYINEQNIWDSFYVTDKHKDIVSLIYNKLKSDENILSHHDGENYLSMIKLHKFLLKSKVDYIIQPIFLIENKSKEISEVVNHEYDHLYDFHTITENHKILSYVTYSSVLPDGRVIEHLHEPGFNKIPIKDIYQEILTIRESLTLAQQLSEELSTNDELSSKRIKL